MEPEYLELGDYDIDKAEQEEQELRAIAHRMLSARFREYQENGPAFLALVVARMGAGVFQSGRLTDTVSLQERTRLAHDEARKLAEEQTSSTFIPTVGGVDEDGVPEE